MSDLNSLTFDQLVPSNSKYLSKEDVGEEGKVLTIKGIRMEMVKGEKGEEEKAVLHFQEPDISPMILNRTNSQNIGIATGAKTAGEAKGKQVLVYNDPTITFQGRVVGGLRIRKVLAGFQPKPSLDDPGW